MSQMRARSEAPRTRSASKHAVWRALEDHHVVMRGLHLGNLFADDPARGERMTSEAAISCCGRTSRSRSRRWMSIPCVS
jgi:hypothetical protein